MKEQLPAQVLAELFSNSLVYTGERFIRTEYVKEAVAVSGIKLETAAKKPDAINKQSIIEEPEAITLKQEPAVNKILPVEEKPVHIAVKSEAVEEKVNKPGKWYLGNYEKRFVVLINDVDNVYLNDKDLEFLTGILNACKMNFAQIALINFKNNAVSFQQLKKELQPRYLVAFGINALQIQLPFSMPDYQVQQYDYCAILTAPPLIDLNATTAAAKTEKGKLWSCLKKMLDL